MLAPFAFASTVVAVTAINNSINNCTTVQPTVVPKRLWKVACLHMVFNSVGHLNNTELLHMDNWIRKIVQDVEEKLYVYVSFRDTTGACASGAVSQYISDVYLKIWDEMVDISHTSLNCVVIGDIPGVYFRGKDSVLMEPDLEVIYTNDSSFPTVTEMNEKRLSLSLAALLSVEHMGNTPFSESMFFFDDPSLVYADVTPPHTPLPLPCFNTVAMGGTFDQLHHGHKVLLTLSAMVCKGTLIVGIMPDHLLKKKKLADKISPFHIRKRNVEDFLGWIKPSLRLDVVQLEDGYGPPIVEENIDAIVVSSETIVGANKINDFRGDKGFKPLQVLVIRRQCAATLSSTFLRSIR